MSVCADEVKSLFKELMKYSIAGLMLFLLSIPFKGYFLGETLIFISIFMFIMSAIDLMFITIVMYFYSNSGEKISSLLNKSVSPKESFWIVFYSSVFFVMLLIYLVKWG